MSDKEEHRKSVRTINQDQEQRLIAACAGRFDRLRPLVICSLDSGLRRSELFEIRWEDVNLEARTITITARSSKTDNSHTVPVSDRMFKELQNLRSNSKVTPGDKVFERLSLIFNKIWRDLVRVADLPSFRFYGLRLSFAERREPRAKD